MGVYVLHVVGVLGEPGADVAPLMCPSEPNTGTTSLVPDIDVMSSMPSFSDSMVSVPYSIIVENSMWNSSAPLALDLLTLF